VTPDRTCRNGYTVAQMGLASAYGPEQIPKDYVDSTQSCSKDGASPVVHIPTAGYFPQFSKLQIRMAAGNGGQASVLRPDRRHFGRNLLYSAKNSFMVERDCKMRLYRNARRVYIRGPH